MTCADVWILYTLINESESDDKPVQQGGTIQTASENNSFLMSDDTIAADRSCSLCDRLLLYRPTSKMRKPDQPELDSQTGESGTMASGSCRSSSSMLFRWLGVVIIAFLYLLQETVSLSIGLVILVTVKNFLEVPGLLDCLVWVHPEESQTRNSVVATGLNRLGGDMAGDLMKAAPPPKTCNGF